MVLFALQFGHGVVVILVGSAIYEEGRLPVVVPPLHLNSVHTKLILNVQFVQGLVVCPQLLRQELVRNAVHLLRRPVVLEHVERGVLRLLVCAVDLQCGTNLISGGLVRSKEGSVLCVKAKIRHSVIQPVEGDHRVGLPLGEGPLVAVELPRAVVPAFDPVLAPGLRVGGRGVGGVHVLEHLLLLAAGQPAAQGRQARLALPHPTQETRDGILRLGRIPDQV
mmetsp:Transcript_14308/g.36071  ORF Transcript_14308/g.36071 Transcript_14308/m.36071 type:complete len:222 (+) Transcript_14308:85-750(+)